MKRSQGPFKGSGPKGETLFSNLPTKMMGYCELKTGHIVIDLTKNENVVRVYLHELIHRSYPKLEESSVLIMENEIWSWLTQEQIFMLGRLLFNRKFMEIL